MVLLHLMYSLKQSLLTSKINISAIYVNHNLSQFLKIGEFFVNQYARVIKFH